ncbi:auxin efflux carrier [Aspergillus nidulans var. acristatus]
MAQGSLLTSFLGALQACVSVLLTLAYGVAARKFGLIQRSSINDVSSLGVKVLLPALILVHLGEQLKLDNALNYVPVLVWSTTYTTFSILLARLASKLLRLPDWVTPASAFNNTTSLPLLLLQSLEGVGSLKVIVKDGESISDAVARAQSYFLLCGVISKTIGYVVGPTMLTSEQNERDGGDDNGRDEDAHYDYSDPYVDAADEESPLLNSHGRIQKSQDTSTVSGKIRRWTKKAVFVFPKYLWQKIFKPDTPMADIAIICTLIGSVLGLVPQLHKAFFNSYEDGGIFNAWLTSSIKNIGKLFTTLQIFVVGCELGVSFEKMKKDANGDGDGDGTGGQSSNPGWKEILTIFLIRLVIWPALSISIIYGLAKKTTLLRSDPILWFSMMLMPAGPPALVIQGLAELAKASDTQKMTIAKTLTVCCLPASSSGESGGSQSWTC